MRKLKDSTELLLVFNLNTPKVKELSHLTCRIVAGGVTNKATLALWFTLKCKTSDGWLEIWFTYSWF